MTVRVSEYYDIFDIKHNADNTVSIRTDGDLPSGIVDTNATNGFSGYSNWSNFATQSTRPYDYSSTQTQGTANPGNNIQASSIAITGKYKAPQAITNIRVDDNGDIWCYPPNVTVPYWNRIIFRNYDYQVNPGLSGKYSTWAESYLNKYQVIYPEYKGTIEKTGTDDYVSGYTPENPPYSISTKNIIYDYKDVPIFLKFDLYPSRSKVIFSSVDKTRNPDIEYRFGCQHSQMEPIKLNLAPSCNNPLRAMEDTPPVDVYYNYSFTKTDIEALLVKCYWSIEWIYDRETGN